MNGTTDSNPGHFIMTDGTIQSSAFGVAVTYGSVNVSGGNIVANGIALKYDGGPSQGYDSSITGGVIETSTNHLYALQLLYGTLSLGGDAEIKGGDYTVVNTSGSLTISGDVTITPAEDATYGVALFNQADQSNTPDDPGEVVIQSGVLNGHLSGPRTAPAPAAARRPFWF